jgi:hypothetical protein
MRQRQLAGPAPDHWKTLKFLFRSSRHEVPHFVAGIAGCRPVCADQRLECASAHFWRRRLLRALVLRRRALVLRRPGVRTELLHSGPLLCEEVLPREALPSSPLLQAELLRSGLRSDLRRCALVRRRAELLRSGTELLREEVLPREALPSSPLLQAHLLRSGLRAELLRRLVLWRRTGENSSGLLDS